MNHALAESFAHCRRIARREARNFYYSFLVLPRAERRAMCALYAFLRATDDIADQPGPAAEQRARLDGWRRGLEATLQGRYNHPAQAALHHTVTAYGIPAELLSSVLDGVQMDLQARRYESFNDLYVYCYRVASVVGRACIRIWGYTAEKAEQYAEWYGIAFQLTNILRDLAEDARQGRVYLPSEDLRRFEYTAEDLAAAKCDERFLRLMQFEAGRAREYYDRARPLFGLIHPAGRAVLKAMVGIYLGILDEIERRRYDVFSGRVELSRIRKTVIALGALPARFFGPPSGTVDLPARYGGRPRQMVP